LDNNLHSKLAFQIAFSGKNRLTLQNNRY